MLLGITLNGEHSKDDTVNSCYLKTYKIIIIIPQNNKIIQDVMKTGDSLKMHTKSITLCGACGLDCSPGICHKIKITLSIFLSEDTS